MSDDPIEAIKSTVRLLRSTAAGIRLMIEIGDQPSGAHDISMMARAQMLEDQAKELADAFYSWFSPPEEEKK